MTQTKEPQYESCVTLRDKKGLTSMGLMSSETWFDDPKRLTFVLARYKFVSKMLVGKQSALEVGCADAFGTRIVRQEVPQVTAVDFDPLFIMDVQERMEEPWRIECFAHDMLSGPVPGTFEAAYALDVIEHITPDNEDIFLQNIAASLTDDGVCILGSPSLNSQTYASPRSKAGHVNCKSGPAIRKLMDNYFKNSFLFSMNDEVVHTGFSEMAHYLLCMGVGKR